MRSNILITNEDMRFKYEEYKHLTMYTHSS
jgi:hypothetical protein